jgi:hypothetical protein
VVAKYAEQLAVSPPTTDWSSPRDDLGRPGDEGDRARTGSPARRSARSPPWFAIGSFVRSKAAATAHCPAGQTSGARGPPPVDEASCDEVAIGPVGAIVQVGPASGPPSTGAAGPSPAPPPSPSPAAPRGSNPQPTAASPTRAQRYIGAILPIRPGAGHHGETYQRAPTATSIVTGVPQREVRVVVEAVADVRGEGAPAPRAAQPGADEAAGVLAVVLAGDSTTRRRGPA